MKWSSWVVSWAMVCLLPGCFDPNIGQMTEPDGPLSVLRLTLLDRRSRDVAVFSDTSVPSDCTAPEVKDSLACYSDFLGDSYGARKSPPTPDSGEEVRVIFNKVPLLLGDTELAAAGGVPTIADPTAAELVCDGCTGAPLVGRTLSVSGSNLSYNPPIYPYGPAIVLAVKADPSRPLAALEPAASYQVRLSPRLAGRDGAALALDDRSGRLLRFVTEPFRLLQVGIGDAAKDPWVYKGTPPLSIADLPADGVIAIRLNAPVDESALTEATVDARIGDAQVPARITPYQLGKNAAMQTVCDAGKRRFLYIAPGAPDLSWGAAAGELVITVRGGEIRDLSQAAGHPAGQGRSALPGDVVIRATLTGQKADPKVYKGLTVGKVSAAADCPGRS